LLEEAKWQRNAERAALSRKVCLGYRAAAAVNKVRPLADKLAKEALMLVLNRYAERPVEGGRWVRYKADTGI